MGGKAEKGTPKYIANKIKAKGLQKLRWYCQMCQKQCRDENGFKCHTMSESHQRQLLLFADNASKYIDQFSKEFADGYLELLSRQFGTKRVNANKVYQDYISNRDHLHMNATQWETLTDFVKWLGREGKCVVDETEKGWFVTYIDRDPATIAAQEAKAKKQKMDKDDQERMLAFIEKQVEKGKKEEDKQGPVYTEFTRQDGQEKIKLNLTVKRKLPSVELPKKLKTSAVIDGTVSGRRAEEENTNGRVQKEQSAKGKEEEELEAARGKSWLRPGIVVKVVGKGPLQNKKGVVARLTGKRRCLVRLDDNLEMEVHQSDLQTVIPSPGRNLIFVNGPHRGTIGVLHKLNVEEFCCSLQITDGPDSGRIIENVQYEDVCKLAT
ncbi:unnamed protein product, partial [Iphiclides podalirius]